MWLCVFREEDLIAKMRKYNDDADVELQKKDCLNKLCKAVLMSGLDFFILSFRSLLRADKEC